MSGTKNHGQLSDLPPVTAHITGHDAAGKAIIQSSRPAIFAPFDKNNLAMSVQYTTSTFPASLNDDSDIKAHDNLMAAKTLGLVNPNGTVCRVVDFAPDYECMMHRTQSLDYGIVLEGEVLMVLDSGETKLMRRGELAVQRGTMHAWRNPSKTDWCRMIFILQDCQKVLINGEEVGEDLGRGAEGLKPSESGGT